MTPDEYRIILDLGPVGFCQSVKLELTGLINATTPRNATAQLEEAARVATWAAERLRDPSFRRGER